MKILFVLLLISYNTLLAKSVRSTLLEDAIESENQIVNFVNTLPQFIHKHIPSQIQFMLYTKNNPEIPDQLRIGDKEGLYKSNYFKNKAVKLLSHGYTDSSNGSLRMGAVKEYVKEDEDINVIAINWSELAKGPYYAFAAFSTQYVGLQAALFLNFLVEQNYAKTGNFHAIGHSLGSHVVGNCGHEYLNITGQKLPRVTGLDPANPLFANGCLFGDDKYRLDPNDGDFVDSIHTAAGEIYELEPGFSHPIAHVDFWPNNGQNQPGCENISVIDERSCSHMRAVVYWVESINSNQFNSCLCKDSDWRGFSEQNCPCEENALMGDKLPSTTKHGNYFIRTNNKSPFARN